MSVVAILSTYPERQEHSYATDPDNPTLTMLMPDNRLNAADLHNITACCTAPLGTDPFSRCPATLAT
jgi:hypothetical protein